MHDMHVAVALALAHEWFIGHILHFFFLQNTYLAYSMEQQARHRVPTPLTEHEIKRARTSVGSVYYNNSGSWLNFL